MIGSAFSAIIHEAISVPAQESPDKLQLCDSDPVYMSALLSFLKIVSIWSKSLSLELPLLS